MEEKETRYKCNGKALLNALEPDRGFYYKRINRDRSVSKKYSFEAIQVFDMTVSGGPDKFYLHANIAESGATCMQRQSYEISEEDYKKFQLNKRGKYRLDLLTKASGGLIVRRKETASKRIDMRVRASTYEQLSASAKKCNMSVTEYCRKVCEEGKVVAAFTDSEIELMTNIRQLSSHLSHYAAFLKNGIFQEMSKRDRLEYLATGESLQDYRREIKQVVTFLHKFVKLQKT